MGLGELRGHFGGVRKNQRRFSQVHNINSARYGGNLGELGGSFRGICGDFIRMLGNLRSFRELLGTIWGIDGDSRNIISL